MCKTPVAGAADDGTSNVCPECGYCPHCNRSTRHFQPPALTPYPGTAVPYPYVPPTIWIGGPSTGTTTSWPSGSFTLT